jgi:hypothetical protein
MQNQPPRFISASDVRRMRTHAEMIQDYVLEELKRRCSHTIQAQLNFNRRRRLFHFRVPSYLHGFPHYDVRQLRAKLSRWLVDSQRFVVAFVQGEDDQMLIGTPS